MTFSKSSLIGLLVVAVSLKALAGGPTTKPLLGELTVKSDVNVEKSGEMLVLKPNAEKKEGVVRTDATYPTPLTITAVAKTSSQNLRLYYRRGMIIFNWERGENQLRYHNPKTNKQIGVADKGSVPKDKFVTIRWTIDEKGSRIEVDGEERAVLGGNLANTSGRVGIGTLGDNTVTVKSFSISTPGSAGVAGTALPATAPAAATAVTIHKVDDSLLEGTLADLKDGKIILKNPDAVVALEDLAELDQKGVAAFGPMAKLSGRIIGTDGSFNNDPNVQKQKAFDGNLDTAFDAPKGTENAWVGLDLGAPRVIRQVKYAPRPGRQFFQDRMIGGKFQGSDSADFSSSVTDLATIDVRPPAKKLSTIDVTAERPFRYVRYLSPPGGSGNVAEVEFWGIDSSPRRVAATPKATTSPATTGPSAPLASVAFGEADRLTGRLASWSDNSLTLSAVLATTSSVAVPLKSVREIWLGNAEQIAKAKALPLESGPDDAAFVEKENNVVAVRGVALGIEGNSLNFKFNDEQRKIAVGKLVGVIFGGQSAKPDRSFHQTVRLAGDDSVSGKWTAYNAGKNAITIETASGAKLELPFSGVQQIRSANGRLTYLSDVKPAAVEQVPYFDRVMPYRTDKSLTGGTIRLSDGEYKHGLSVHARCVLTYDLGGEFAEFKCKVGFQQPEGKNGQASLRVMGDGKVLWKDENARGDAKPVEIALKIGEVKQLTLEADFGPEGDTGARVDWADARVLRAGK